VKLPTSTFYMIKTLQVKHESGLGGPWQINLSLEDLLEKPEEVIVVHLKKEKIRSWFPGSPSGAIGFLKTMKRPGGTGVLTCAWDHVLVFFVK